MKCNAIRIHPDDDVAVMLGPVERGHDVSFDEAGQVRIRAAEDIESGHKIAIRDIRQGELIHKYGFPIGRATEDILRGAWVHAHNLSTTLTEQKEFHYHPSDRNVTFDTMDYFNGFLRTDGMVGVRNEIWILPMVSCVNHTARLIAERCKRLIGNIDGVFALEQPFGCSQLGEDHQNTVAILRDIATHPNCAGVLLVSLGCENNTIAEFFAGMGEYDTKRIQYLVAQDHPDEVATGAALVKKLIRQAKSDFRSKQPMSKLRVGLKCGASDAFSGITANPLVGRVCDRLVLGGASVVLTEVPEMFGAEAILLERAPDRKRFDAIDKMIRNFKQYYIDQHQPVYENPSPGNKDGGITTLEEKSIGCVQKGGHAQVEDVLDYGQKVRVSGLSLLSGPGNDPVSITALACSGCQVIVFTTGRGNPLGSLVPTLKIGSNTQLSLQKKHWIDFDAGQLLGGSSMDGLSDDLYALILDVAGGRKTRSEIAGYKEISIFKTGVTL